MTLRYSSEIPFVDGLPRQIHPMIYPSYSHGIEIYKTLVFNQDFINAYIGIE